MENQTELTVVVSTELEAVVNQNTSIEPTKAQAHALRFAPNMNEVHELSKALTTMDKANPSDTDAKVARINRLALVKNRTATGKIKDELKASLLVETKLIDSLHNVVKHTSELTELQYEAIEKFAEIREKERKEALRIERTELLSDICDNPSIYPLGDFEQDAFDNLYEGLKLAHQAKIDAIIKAENERIELEAKAEAERIEAKRIADEQAEAQRLENIRLKAENDAKEKQLAEERLKAENERKAEAKKQADIQAQKDAELAKQKAENEKIQQQLQDKKDSELKAENERKAEAKKQADIQAQKDAELAKQKAENEKIQQQLQDKKDSELKAENERKAAIEAENKAKEALLKAGDEAILTDWINGLQIEKISMEGLTEDGIKKADEIFGKFIAFKVWAQKTIK